ncbi:glycosyltransferase [Aurantiacibacter spongiae]|uniref:Glycosyltransferase n=1 Tax=Aurantiacibacter spongiae TaxID=2488860 RepID=A0A3N5DK84_9SPHN|nr:glycosyltransferase [Aurantiacibacter spongiae]RPF71165.1 glycosyltransferase [Aurantiacibacter spongiae]
MRVLSILTTLTTGGAETLVTNLAGEFVRRGHDALVVSLSDADQVGNPVEIERSMKTRLRSDGALFTSLALASRANLAKGAWRLRRAIRDFAPDVIHAHTARAVPMLALAGVRVPVVLTHHNTRLSFPPWAYRLFDRTVTGNVAISAECEAQTRALSRRPVRRIANAADPRFRVERPRIAPADRPLVLAVGTPSRQKDYPTLVRAARPLREALGRDVTIRIAGGGAELPALRALVEEVGAGDIVELLGPRSDMPDLMRQADLLANSSLWEGFAIAMIEASMAALPIVATDVNGSRELVENGRNGLRVPVGDPQALGEAIARVLGDADLYAAMSAAALEAGKAFGIEHCAAAHLDWYRQLSGNASQRASRRAFESAAGA